MAILHNVSADGVQLMNLTAYIGRASNGMVDMDKISKEIEWHEGLTHVYVDFAPHFGNDEPHVTLDGVFYARELSKIASILRKLEKKDSKKKVTQQDTLWSNQ